MPFFPLSSHKHTKMKAENRSFDDTIECVRSPLAKTIKKKKKLPRGLTCACRVASSFSGCEKVSSASRSPVATAVSSKYPKIASTTLI